MKAIICPKYGPPEILQLGDIEKPVPKEKEVLIKIHATTVTAGDCEIRGLKFPPMMKLLIRLGFGLKGPRRKVIGQEFAGEIEAVGKSVTRFKKGDKIFGSPGMKLGTYAEYCCLPEDGPMIIKPPEITFGEGAAIPLGGLEALHFLRKGNIQKGEKVLIIGAGGSIGTAGIQLARNFGGKITAIDSTSKLDKMLSIGAEQVIDFTKEDFTKMGQTYDVIFDIVGKNSFSDCIGLLNENGRYLIANPGLSHKFKAILLSMRSNKKVISDYTVQRSEDLSYLAEQIVGGKIKILIDKVFPLEQMVKAHQYVETGAKKGNLVITVMSN